MLQKDMVVHRTLTSYLICTLSASYAITANPTTSYMEPESLFHHQDTMSTQISRIGIRVSCSSLYFLILYGYTIFCFSGYLLPGLSTKILCVYNFYSVPRNGEHSNFTDVPQKSEHNKQFATFQNLVTDEKCDF
jgi:hypothetical protein